MTKSLPISKRMVYNSYLKVSSNKGGSGIDRESIEMFEKNLSGNLYKLWNRMCSGSYIPPAVRTVFIPKKQGGKRALGIPTVSDRIAQSVVKDYIEPFAETVFHPSSYGYRPCRSAHDALQQCLNNCRTYAWVIDVDIKGFFDNISHEILMKLLKQHTHENWVLLYTERWLKAGVEQEDGTIKKREKGTPQGGVISPLLSNIYLHHAFDQWMKEENPRNPFERYADDVVIHCRNEKEATELLEKLKTRLQEYELELHPEKTKIVYCKNYQRKGNYSNNSFTFLSYNFQPMTIKSKTGQGMFVVFSAMISGQAMTHIRSGIRQILRPEWSNQKLEWFANVLNPKIRGWINYYTKFNKYKAYDVFRYLNELIRSWIKHTYKILGKGKVYDKYRLIQQLNPELFYHWKLGIKS